MRQAAPLLRGIRRNLPVPQNASSCDMGSSLFAQGVQELGQRGLLYEMLSAGPASLACAWLLPSAFPNMTFVLDHMGGPAIATSAGVDQQWLASMQKLAHYPNVIVKVCCTQRNLLGESTAALDARA